MKRQKVWATGRGAGWRPSTIRTGEFRICLRVQEPHYFRREHSELGIIIGRSVEVTAEKD
jgi:hypothetical protein